MYRQIENRARAIDAQAIPYYDYDFELHKKMNIKSKCLCLLSVFVVLPASESNL